MFISQTLIILRGRSSSELDVGTRDGGVRRHLLFKLDIGTLYGGV